MTISLLLAHPLPLIGRGGSRDLDLLFGLLLASFCLRFSACVWRRKVTWSEPEGGQEQNVSLLIATADFLVWAGASIKHISF